MPRRGKEPDLELVLVEEYHRSMGADCWDTERLDRLCGLMKTRRAILGAMVGLTPAQLESCCQRNSFPRPVGMLLQQLWNWKAAKLGLANPPVMPVHLAEPD